jgi:excisionase family DNA binding protein
LTASTPYGQGARMLTLGELCAWLNITERHARKLVERRAIPYRKVGHLLRFAEQEIDQWSRPQLRPEELAIGRPMPDLPATRAHNPGRTALPKSLIEQEDEHAQQRAS